MVTMSALAAASDVWAAFASPSRRWLLNCARSVRSVSAFRMICAVSYCQLSRCTCSSWVAADAR